MITDTQRASIAWRLNQSGYRARRLPDGTILVYEKQDRRGPRATIKWKQGAWTITCDGCSDSINPSTLMRLCAQAIYAL